MIVVSDTTPLTYLVQIEQVFLLQCLYRKIIVPPAVYHELLQYDKTKTEVSALFGANWVTIQKPTSLIELPAIPDLGKGEWEAISLAIEIKADLLLMDEWLGTSLAARFNLETIGLLGVLIEAKRSQIIPAVKPLLDRLVAKRFFINKDLYNKILSLVNE